MKSLHFHHSLFLYPLFFLRPLRFSFFFFFFSNNVVGLLPLYPFRVTHPLHQHERDTTNRDQRQHDDDADDMRGETFPFFFCHEAGESSLFKIVHGRSAGTRRRVYQTLRQFHSILRGVPELNEESTCQSSGGRSAGTPLWSLPGYSCLPHLWVWRVGSKMSSQMPGPKWLTSSPTAHHTPPFRTSIPHESLTSHNPAQHIHSTTQPSPVRVQTCQTRNNTHM